MVRFNPSGTSTRKPLLPNGNYRCRIDDVETTVSRKGDEMWKLRLLVTDGEHQGRRVYDRIVFSTAAMKRVLCFCRALGIPITGEVELTPDMVRGKHVVVAVQAEDYQDNEGHTHTANCVAFQGYSPAGDTGQVDDDKDLPF